MVKLIGHSPNSIGLWIINTLIPSYQILMVCMGVNRTSIPFWHIWVTCNDSYPNHCASYPRTRLLWLRNYSHIFTHTSEETWCSVSWDTDYRGSNCYFADQWMTWSMTCYASWATSATHKGVFEKRWIWNKAIIIQFPWTICALSQKDNRIHKQTYKALWSRNNVKKIK